MDFISNFANNFERFETVLKPQLEHSGISSSAALILLCLCKECNLTKFAKEQYLMELFTVGFAEMNNGLIVATNKGLIVAKSLSITLNKNGL